MGSRIDAVIFDLDGVLLDSEPLVHRAMNAYLTPDYVSDEEYAAIVGTTNEYMWHWIRERYRPAESIEEIGPRVLDFIYAELDASIVAPLDGAAGLLDALRAGGRSVAVASQSSPRWVAASLRAIGLADRFPVVVTSSEVRAGKPAPDVYLHAAARLGVPPARCLAIEDSVPGLRAAHAAGMTVVQLRQSKFVPPPQPEAHAVIETYRDFDLGWLDGAPLARA